VRAQAACCAYRAALLLLFRRVERPLSAISLREAVVTRGPLSVTKSDWGQNGLFLFVQYREGSCAVLEAAELVGVMVGRSYVKPARRSWVGMGKLRSGLPSTTARPLCCGEILNSQLEIQQAQYRRA